MGNHVNIGECRNCAHNGRARFVHPKIRPTAKNRSHWSQSMLRNTGMQSRGLILACLLLSTQAGRAQAQGTPGPDGRTIVPRDTSDAQRHKTLFTYRDAALAAGFAVVTVAMFPADRHIAESLRDPDLQANKFFDCHHQSIARCGAVTLEP